MDATDRKIAKLEDDNAKLRALLVRAQQFTGDYIDHAGTWEMCAVAELDADMCHLLAQSHTI